MRREEGRHAVSPRICVDGHGCALCRGTAVRARVAAARGAQPGSLTGGGYTRTAPCDRCLGEPEAALEEPPREVKLALRGTLRRPGLYGIYGQDQNPAKSALLKVKRGPP